MNALENLIFNEEKKEKEVFNTLFKNHKRKYFIKAFLSNINKASYNCNSFVFEFYRQFFGYKMPDILEFKRPNESNKTFYFLSMICLVNDASIKPEGKSSFEDFKHFVNWCDKNSTFFNFKTYKKNLKKARKESEYLSRKVFEEVRTNKHSRLVYFTDKKKRLIHSCLLLGYESENIKVLEKKCVASPVIIDDLSNVINKYAVWNPNYKIKRLKLNILKSCLKDFKK
jgi:hypothetical protein